MKVGIDCVHCYLKQAVTAMHLAGLDENSQHEVLYTLMDDIKKLDRAKTPAENSSEVLLKTYELIHNDDPYKAVKKESNDQALSLVEYLQSLVNKYEDSLECAIKLAVAGNVIDLGIHRSYDIEAAISHSLDIGLSINHYDKFRKALDKTDSIMILGDNSGEIVFDMILVEELKKLGKDVIYVVKEGPILNDSTLEDAKYVGMDKLARVITNGSNYLGTCLSKVSPEFIAEFKKSPLIISKGQANFESLEAESKYNEKIYFLLKLKCEGVAQTASGSYGDIVFLKR